jgi:hypothetical protein
MRRVVPTLALAIFLLLGALIFPSAGWDDAYITYWQAHALATAGQIVNVNGQAVEQSSSLGLVLILAVLRKLTGVDVSIVGRLVSIAFGAATIAATARLARRVDAPASRYVPILLATNTYFIYWSFGGMEASLAGLSGVLLLTWLIEALDSGAPAPLVLVAVTSFVYLSSRPESLLILTATLAGLAVFIAARRFRQAPLGAWERRAPGELARFAAACAAAAASLLLFRFWYFDRMFPQPVYAKAHALSKQKISEGLAYVSASVQSDFFIAAALAGAATAVLVWSAVSRTRSRVETSAAVFLVASLAFIVMSGGDGMHGGRFFVPAIPVALVMGVSLISRALSAQTLRTVVAAWVVIQLGGVFLFARGDSHSELAWAVGPPHAGTAEAQYHWFERANLDHRRYIPAMTALERAIDNDLPNRKPIVILSGQSGFALYHLAKIRYGTLRYLDRFGLATRDFLECPASARLPRTNWGLLLAVERYLRQIDQFDRCGIPRPDLIYDLYWDAFPDELSELLTRTGYSVRYLQDEDAIARAGILARRTVGRVYIAVRQSPVAHDAQSR